MTEFHGMAKLMKILRYNNSFIEEMIFLKKYIIFNIIMPILLIFILPIMIFVFAIQYFSISEINLLFVTLEINENADISNYISSLSVITTIIV